MEESEGSRVNMEEFINDERRNYMVIYQHCSVNDDQPMNCYIGYRYDFEGLYSAQIDSTMPVFTDPDSAALVVHALNYMLAQTKESSEPTKEKPVIRNKYA